MFQSLEYLESLNIKVILQADSNICSCYGTSTTILFHIIKLFYIVLLETKMIRFNTKLI